MVFQQHGILGFSQLEDNRVSRRDRRRRRLGIDSTDLVKLVIHVQALPDGNPRGRKGVAEPLQVPIPEFSGVMAG